MATIREVILENAALRGMREYHAGTTLFEIERLTDDNELRNHLVSGWRRAFNRARGLTSEA